MAEAFSNWRPSSALNVPLSDRDLAKIGLLAQLERQCKASLMSSLKSLQQLSTDEWQRLDTWQFRQLVESITEVATIDDRLTELVARVQADFEETLKLRNQNVHGIWATGTTGQGEPIGYDIKRGETLSTSRLDDDLRRVADLTHNCHACTMRVAELIVEGKLPEGVGNNGPHIHKGGRWVKL